MRVALCLLFAACASTPTARAPETPKGVLVVSCAQTDAVLVIDEQAFGELRALQGGVRLATGSHRVELHRDGYHTRYAEVTVGAGTTQTLELRLAEAYP